MEVTGKIIQVLPLQKGIGKTSGKEWQLQGYVLETQEQYPRKVHFELFGEDRVKQNVCSINDIVKVSYDIESREFNGRWYTSIRAWRVDKNINEIKEEPANVIHPEEVDALASMPDADTIRASDEIEEESSDLPF